MPAFSGKYLVVLWFTDTAGTVDLSGDFRQFSYNEANDMIDQTAGADANKTYIPGLKDNQSQLTAIYQKGGTALLDAVTSGLQGTLFVSPEGTTTGNRKITIPAITASRNMAQPYNDVVELSVTFQGNGAITNGKN